MIRKLFSASPVCIGRFDGPPTSDAAPASLVDGTPGDLKADLRTIDLVRYASDASPYRLVPQVVVCLERPMTLDAVARI